MRGSSSIVLFFSSLDTMTCLVVITNLSKIFEAKAGQSVFVTNEDSTVPFMTSSIKTLKLLRLSFKPKAVFEYTPSFDFEKRKVKKESFNGMKIA